MGRTGRTNAGRPCRAVGGFTLVEILSAMALAVLIMVGLAQVFKMSSDAVAEAEATSGTYQQARGALGMLQRDFLQNAGSGGYIWVVPGETRPQRYYRRTTSRPSEGQGCGYQRDTLYFAAVGAYQEMGTDLQNAPPTIGGGAEVVYTLGWRAHAGKPVLPYEPIDASEDDPRTMLLVRKAFLLSGARLLQSMPLGYTSALYLGSTVDPASSDPARPKSSLSLMMTDRWPLASFPRYRVAQPTLLAPLMIHVDPTWSGANWAIGFEGYPTYDPDVNCVVAERVSEFLVETWEADASGVFQWRRDKPPGSFYPPPSSGKDAYPRAKLWCGNAPRPATVPQSGTTYYPQPNMPNLIRVTLVIHPHNDVARLMAEPYAGNIATPLPGHEPRFRGEVFREVFRVNGRVQHASDSGQVGGQYSPGGG